MQIQKRDKLKLWLKKKRANQYFIPAIFSDFCGQKLFAYVKTFDYSLGIQINRYNLFLSDTSI